MTSKDYKTFIRHASKVTKSPAIGERIVLTGVKHYENGSMAVTDSHRLYLANEMHNKGEALLSTTGKEMKDQFPDVSRLIPDQSEETIKLDVDEMFKGVDIIMTGANAVNEEPVMSWKGDLLSFDSELLKAKYELSFSLPVEDALHSNAKYWLEALQMFRAFRYKEVEFSFHGRFRPFTLTSLDGKLMALLLPIRRY